MSLALVLVSTASMAHPGPEVVPPAERERAAALAAQGPAENRGIEDVSRLGGVDLGREFEGLAGRELRAREIVIAPGGVIGVHEHDRRPGMAYILEGEIVEHRSDAQEPLLRRAGEAAFEWSGVVHWWENRSNTPVRALVVDIVPAEAR
ncbi:cupin domain-containing protein [Ectothiorhodospiraceae bacterium 2226]|nr:cupin domain-containing protein [Ectothiorhodospiraceae bacterium 2226]